MVSHAIDILPNGLVCPEVREKPWGINHVLLMGKDLINEPFALINADDFYGSDSFAVEKIKTLIDLEECLVQLYC